MKFLEKKRKYGRECHLTIVVEKPRESNRKLLLAWLWQNGVVSQALRDRRTRSNERRLPLGAPARAWVLSEWALLPLRIFLGVTFLFAGLQKLANPTFFNSKSPSGIHAQLLGSIRTSPLHALLAHLVNFSTPIGLTIAGAEVAIGVGVLLGLWTRVAAVGGVLLSLSLFLAVSYHSSPYYTGADIVFVFAWLPFVLSGSPSRFSIDAWVTNYVAEKSGTDRSEYVAIPFAQLQRICGNFDDQTCAARKHLACDAAVCPVLLGSRAPKATPVAIRSLDRRSLIVGGAAAASVAAAAVIVGSAVAATGRLIGNATLPKPASKQLPSGGTTTPTTSGGATYSGTLLGPATGVPANEAATFTIPTSGDPGIIFNEGASKFLSYDAVCPHMGCTVGYSPSAKLLVCPCHGSEFLVSTGAVISGPAPRGLLKLDVVEEPDGNLYLK
jgi:thiosulfate dehydrogenase [quinone] large subunit